MWMWERKRCWLRVWKGVRSSWGREHDGRDGRENGSRRCVLGWVWHVARRWLMMGRIVTCVELGFCRMTLIADKVHCLKAKE